MKSIKARQTEKHVTAERLQATARVARSIPQDSTAHGIGDARLKLLETARLATDALSGPRPELK